MPDPGRTLILVRHSLPEMVAGVPASQWSLSTEGRRRCKSLAERLAEHKPTFVITSEEPKAIETGKIVARLLSLPCESELGLHEHERAVIQDLDSRESFQAQVTRFFEHPDQLVFGRETADQAYARFTAALARIVEKYPLGTLAIVSHGTVMALFIARANGFTPVPFWKSLGLPAFAVLSLPGFDLVQIVQEILNDSTP
jgi:broad specificity phosphatase PhoE